MKAFKTIILVFMVAITASAQNPSPDLTDKDDLASLGVGRIIEKDKTILKNITIHEVKEFWIIYVQNENLHDMLMERIDRMEFPDSKWGSLTIRFPQNKPVISGLKEQKI